MNNLLGNGSANDLFGTDGNDFIAGEGGADLLQGNGGDDVILGGGGNDTIEGNDGNDTLFGSTSKGGAVDMNKFVIGQDVTGTVTFNSESAAYKNTLGMYKIAADGTIYDVQVLFANASLQGSGGNLVSGQSSVKVDLKAGDQVGFFVVPNSFSKSGMSSLHNGEGSFEFRDADGNPGTVNGGEVNLVHVSADGVETVVKSQYGTSVFHSLDGAEGGLNGDNYDHVKANVDVESGTVRIGFEDLWNGGDKDFDDSVFTFDIGVTNSALLPKVASQPGTSTDDDKIDGGNGNDEMFGMRGNDTMSGGEGDDQMWGNSGDDMMSGGNGNDKLNGGSGNDALSGDAGNDVIHGNSGDDRISGGDGNDQLFGDSGNDMIADGAGDDVVSGGSGDDQFLAGAGNDAYNGGSGFDAVSYANAANGVNVDLHAHSASGLGGDKLKSIEQVDGSSFDDTFKGNKDDNVFNGGAGDDSFRGLGGADVFTGGEGNDVYSWYAKDIVDSKTGAHLGVDTITDFQQGDELNFHELLKGMDYESVGDVVHMTEGERGTMVSVQMGDQFVDVVMLQGVHGVDADDLAHDGSILV